MAEGHWLDDTGLEHRPVDMRNYRWSTRSLWLWPLFILAALNVPDGWVLAVMWWIPAGLWLAIFWNDWRRERRSLQARRSGSPS